MLITAACAFSGTPLKRPVVLAFMADVPDQDPQPFDDFERECFGDEDGCDAWFYGEDPEKQEPGFGSAALDEAAYEKKLAEGEKAVEARLARKAAYEAFMSNKRSRE